MDHSKKQVFLPIQLRQFDAILSRRLNNYLRDTTGLDITELSILVTACEDQRSQKQLAAILSLHENVMTQVVRRLESKELLKRENDPRDRRRLLVLPTPRAKTLVKKIQRASGKVTRKLLYPLSDEQIEQLHSLVRRLIEARSPAVESLWQDLHALGSRLAPSGGSLAKAARAE